MQKPDLVHIHNTFVMISPSIYAACREAGIPVVQTLHNYRLFCPAATFFRNGRICEKCIDHTLWRSVRHGCYRGSRPATVAVASMLAVHRVRQTWTRDITSYIALTKFAQDKCVQGGLPAEKIFIKPNFVHPDPGPRNGCSDGDYAIFVGRLSPEKRVSTLLEAWALSHNRIPLLIIGGGPQYLQAEEVAERRGLDTVTFLGVLPHDQTLAAIKRARLLIFASEWYETFGLTIVEAFACGVPVICSRLGAMQEIVDDGRTGLHFTSGDAEDLADKTQWAWDNPARTRSMGREARREYENKYTAEKNYPLLSWIFMRRLFEAEGPWLNRPAQMVP